MKIAINGLIQDEKNAVIPALTDGLYYGAGCFETFRSYEGKFLFLNKHVERLNAGLAYLTGNNAKEFSTENIRNEIMELLEANDLKKEQAKVRLQISLGDAYGYSLDQQPKMIRILTVEELTPQKSTVELISTDTRVVPHQSKPPVHKLSNMLHYRHAGREAKKKGADDALMLTYNGWVAETSVANIFWEKEGVVYTPSMSCDILPGVMRAIICSVLDGMNMRVEKGKYLLPELKNARQIWITNSVKEICRVETFDGRRYETETPLWSELEQNLKLYKHSHWN